tara:strand:+ start:155 stop:610 length:456 start_codon:yes stop_codon:yes gene_type:complete
MRRSKGGGLAALVVGLGLWGGYGIGISLGFTGVLAVATGAGILFAGVAALALVGLAAFAIFKACRSAYRSRASAYDGANVNFRNDQRAMSTQVMHRQFQQGYGERNVNEEAYQRPPTSNPAHSPWFDSKPTAPALSELDHSATEASRYDFY